MVSISGFESSARDWNSDLLLYCITSPWASSRLIVFLDHNPRHFFVLCCLCVNWGVIFGLILAQRGDICVCRAHNRIQCSKDGE